MTVVNGYATLSDVKSALRIADSVDDSLLELSIEAASREIDGYCERVFYNAGTATRSYVPVVHDFVDIDDCTTVTKIETFDGTAWNELAVTDYQVEPLNNVAGGVQIPKNKVRPLVGTSLPVIGGDATVRVTGVWGWAAVPTAVKQACVLLAARHFKRYDSPLGVAGFGDLGAIRVGRVDPDVQALLAPYMRVAVS